MKEGCNRTNLSHEKETVNAFMPEDMMPDNIKHCPICNGGTFTSGRIAAGHNAVFVANEPPAGFFQLFTGDEIQARCCNKCGNLQLFVQN